MNLFVILALCLTAAYGAYGNLRSVLLVYRHGDRTPTDFSPKDEHSKPIYWAVEPGELTNRGKFKQYELGVWLRTRYNGFLPATYHKRDIYVRSSAEDRCLMSAGANLAGLYPPSGDQVWSSIQWMPIPIHSVPAKQDNLLKMGRACPNYEPKYLQVLNGENFTEINQDNAALYKFLTENLGKKVANLNDIENAYDTLSVEAEHNMKLPEWTEAVINGKKVYPDEMKKYAELAYQIPTYTTELARLGAGRFLDTLASQFEAVSKNDTQKMLAEKMVMFSAHKSTIGDITNTLGVFRSSPYAGALIFELKQHPSTHLYYVNTFFKTPKGLEQLRIGGCENDCDFQKFLDTLKPFRMTQQQWEAECLSSNEGSSATGIFSSMITFLSVILSLIFWKCS